MTTVVLHRQRDARTHLAEHSAAHDCQFLRSLQKNLAEAKPQAYYLACPSGRRYDWISSEAGLMLAVFELTVNTIAGHISDAYDTCCHADQIMHTNCACKKGHEVCHWHKRPHMQAWHIFITCLMPFRSSCWCMHQNTDAPSTANPDCQQL